MWQRFVPYGTHNALNSASLASRGSAIAAAPLIEAVAVSRFDKISPARRRSIKQGPRRRPTPADFYR